MVIFYYAWRLGVHFGSLRKASDAQCDLQEEYFRNGEIHKDSVFKDNSTTAV